jgi:hypothetical protein
LPERGTFAAPRVAEKQSLTGTTSGHTQKNPAFRRDFPAFATFELAILWRLLALTIRILLLLARLLTAALLLAGLLAGILVLLAGVLVLIRHRRSPLLKRSSEQLTSPGLVSRKDKFRRDRCMVIVWRNCGCGTRKPK